MGNSKLSLVLLTVLVLTLGFANACEYHDHGDCKVTETIVEGKIFIAETNESVGNADVTIICTHNGVDYTKTTNSANVGMLKGTYFVLFPQSQCIAGDEVTVSAVKDNLNGEEESTVHNWITQRCLDVDIAIVNVPLVPEFGAVVGILTVMGALGAFFIVRRH